MTKELNIKRIRIQDVNNKYYDLFLDLYIAAFPLFERRTKEQLPGIFEIEGFYLDAWVTNDQLVGFIGWWDDASFRYVEHYAIHSSHRSSGFGSRFLSEWIQDSSKPVILEIELVEDELTARRLEFYQRLSFVINDHIRHIQPPYHKETHPVPYEILSYPDLAPEATYQRFKEQQAHKYMTQFN